MECFWGQHGFCVQKPSETIMGTCIEEHQFGVCGDVAWSFCCPEQLRPATFREELVEHLRDHPEPEAPWTFPRVVMSELGDNEYEDISQEVPDVAEWQRSQDPERQNNDLSLIHI